MARIYLKSLMLTSALTTAAMLCVIPAYAAPDGGVVTDGSASINQAGSVTTITQTTDRGIIRWNSFDLGSSETVKFLQPNSSSITVNRVMDSKASQIDGRIEANGNIMILNPNGIIFGSTARIDVAGLVAATSQIDDSAFMAGDQVLKMTPGGNAAAKIINEGRITARDAGLVGLVAPNVENNGIIEAHLGRVTLAGAERVTLDLAGDSLITIDITDESDGFVKNTGDITADGGRITLTAARARDTVETSIVNTGKLQANSVGIHNGRIMLMAGGNVKNMQARPAPPKPAIQNAGEIIARGNLYGETGGMIDLLGDAIELTETSHIDASAMNNAGTIRIGGDYQGAGDSPTATWVTAAHGSLTVANSLFDGDGGNIFIWSDRNTFFRGRAEAEAGEENGDGGFIEVSGKNILYFDGTASTRAPKGRQGTLLLDPTDIEIVSAADVNVTASSPFAPNADDVVSQLSSATLLAALAGSDVIVQTRTTGSQAGNITVSTGLSWISASKLTLDAHNNIIVNSAITGQNVSFIAGGDVQLNANVTGTGTISFEQKDVTGTIGVGTAAGGIMNLSAADLTRVINGWSQIIIGRTDSTGTVNVDANTWQDNLELRSGSGAISINGTQNFAANNLTIVTDADPVINGALTGTGTLTVRGALTGTTMGLGNGAAGTLSIDTTEVGNITNGWGNLIFGRTDGTGNIAVSALTWNDFLTLQTGTGVINISGTQTLGANNLTIRTDANPIIGGNLAGTATITFVQTSAGTTIGLGNAQTGTLNLDTAEVGRITNGWANIIIGRTDGTGVINAGALTWNDFLTFNSGSGVININGTQTLSTNNNLTFTTNADINLAAGLTAAGTTAVLTIGGASAGTSIGIGTGQTGTIQLSNAEQANITNGWGSIIFGRTDQTADINLGARTWNDNLTLRTLSGAININGNQNLVANNLTITTDSNPFINGTLTSTGTLTIAPQSISTSMALGTGQTGTILLDDTELNNIVNGWGSLIFGSTTQTGAINVGARTWNDSLTLRNASGAMNINGAQNLSGNNLTISTDSNLLIGGALTSAGGTLTISGQANSTTIGIGTAQAGTLNLDNTELGLITDGWASIAIGTTSTTGAMNVGAYTWLDPLTLRTAAGQMNINGNLNMGANNLTITSNSNIALNGTLTGALGTLAISTTSVASSLAIGTGQTGTVLLDDTELARIADGWGSIIFGQTGGTGAVNIGAYTWLDNITFRSGTGLMTIAGTQNLGTNNLTINTDSNLALNADLIGTGNLQIASSAAATTIAIGTGQTGTILLDNTELAHFVNGWNQITIGSTAGTGAMNVGSNTWNDNLFLTSAAGVITINGTTIMSGTNNLTITTDGNPVINTTVSGQGTLNIRSNALGTTVGIGTGQTGTLNLDNSDLGNILSNWSQIIFGRNDGTGAMNIGAYNWQFNTMFTTNSGVITVNGAQALSGESLIFETNGNLALNAALSGNGTLIIRGAAAGTAMGIGTGQAGALGLIDAELTQIQDGWSKIIFGRSDMSSQMNIGVRTWLDDVQFITGSGQLRVNAAQTMGANNLTLTTDSDLLLSANLTGTGRLIIEPASISTSIGVGTGQTGALTLNATDLSRFVAGWAGIQIGNNTMTGNINIGTNTWGNRMTFLTRGNVVLNGIQTSTLTSGTTLIFVTLAGAFQNTAGATPINPGTGGRYLIYSVAAANDTYGGLSVPTTVLAKSYYGYTPASVVETGNVKIHSQGSTKTLFLQIDNKTKVYGDNLPNFTYTYLGGLEGTDSLSAALTSATLSASGASVLDNAGTTTLITGSFLTGLGYVTNVLNGTLTVTKAPVTIQPQNTFRIYGNADPTFTANFIGLKNGDTSAVLTTQPTFATNATILSNVAANYNITASGAVASNYVFNYGTGVLDIQQATLTLKADNLSRVYGDANPILTITYTGFKNGDTASVIDIAPIISTSATTLSDVADYAITLLGGTDNNYILVLQDGTLSITKALLTATADDKSRIYGDANPALTVSYSGFKNGETSSVIDTLATASTTATNTSNVGNVAITASGAIDNNYDFAYVNGNLTITKALLTATADDKSRIYGDANPALTVSYSGFKNGETSSVIDTLATASTTATNTSNVGNVAITASGAIDNNYDFAYVNGNLTITKALLTATADDKSRIYGDANPALTVSYSGFKNGETSSVIDTLATASTTATNTSNVGNVAITASGAIDNNYDFAYVNGNLTITKALLTATADDKSRIYGDANPALTVSYSGFKNGETSSVIDTLATASTTATNTSNVGNVAITASGAIDNNYDFAYVNGNLTITKALLTATADDKSRIYGDANPALTVSYSGFKNGETSSVIDTLATASTTATNTSNVGNVAITASGAIDNNYDFAYVNGNLTITKALLTATADDKSRIYGDANPALTVSYSGFKNGETSSVIDTLATASTTATNTSNVGNVAITASGAIDNNYDFAYVNGNLTITKALLTATADDKSRIYGDANPALTVSYSGFKNGETSSVIDTLATASTTATNTSNVGNVAITASGAIDNNYDFAYVNGNLTITKALLTATADDKSRIYGDANPALTVSYSGFKNGETSSVIDTLATASTTATNTSNVGNVAITASGAIDNNYDFAYVNGNLTITKALLTATADDKSRLEGDPNPPLTFSTVGFKNGEGVGVISGIVLSTPANIFSSAGPYNISISGGTATNYNFAYVSGILTVLASGGGPPPLPPSPPVVTQPTVPQTLQAAISSPIRQSVSVAELQFENRHLGNVRPKDGGMILDGYMTINYKDDPFSFAAPTALIFIDPTLYVWDWDRDRQLLLN